MNSLEPSRPAFASPFGKYFAATRPAFLSVTLACALIGLGSADQPDQLTPAIKATIAAANLNGLLLALGLGLARWW